MAGKQRLINSKSLNYVAAVLICCSCLLLEGCIQKGSELSSPVGESTSFTSPECQKAWDLVWKKAKEGSLEGRAALATMIWTNMSPPMTEKIWDRYFVPLQVYALGYEHESPYSKEIPGDISSHYQNIRSPENEEFFVCLEKNPSQKCTQIAIEKKIIPPFEVFAKEVDTGILAGEKPHCSNRTYL